MGEDRFRNLQPGTVVNSRYEVVKGLGTGSMGVVYACRDRELGGRLVAMKVLFAEVAADKVSAARFKNEIFASYSVNHPNVVRAYEYFVDRDIVAYTMEYVGGGDLAERMGNSQLIAIEDIIKILTQMCCGVFAIHKEGIIHRDLKPENILITSQGDIKITDFGVARCGTGPKLTEHGGVLGTIDYVSPEYLELGHVDARSDIYAIGVLGYEMITGKAPFVGQSVIETMTMRLRTDPRPPSDLRRNCPPSLSSVILRAMNKNPADRYQTADAIVADLDAIPREQLTRSDNTSSRLDQSITSSGRSDNSQSNLRRLVSGMSSSMNEQTNKHITGLQSVPVVHSTRRQSLSDNIDESLVRQADASFSSRAQSVTPKLFTKTVETTSVSVEVNTCDNSALSSITQAPSEIKTEQAYQTVINNTKENGTTENEFDELEINDSFASQGFFFICIIVLGFALGIGGVYAYGYIKKLNDPGFRTQSNNPHYKS